jgi:mRNA-degrading endonuclease YafQ of YafQ-DinJ toxin-antitoxin module
MGLLGNSTDLQERSKDHMLGSSTGCKQDNGTHIQPAAVQVYRPAAWVVAVQAV